MFEGCKGLTAFHRPLPQLVNGEWMFYDSSLETFDSSAPQLVCDEDMFENTPIERSSGIRLKDKKTGEQT